MRSAVRAGAIAVMVALAVPAHANELDTLRTAGRLSQATMLSDVPVEPADPVWDRVAPVVLRLYPQSSVPPVLEGAEIRSIEARIVIAGDRLAVRLAWDDRTEDRWRTDRTDAFADGAAIQFAVGEALPYVGMGEPGRPVRLWTWRAGRATEHLTAQGFGSLAAAEGAAPQASARRSDRGWTVVLRGAAPAEMTPIAMAFAVWDGAGDQRDGRKRITAWHLVVVPGRAGDDARLHRLAREAAVAGDARRGRTLLTDHGCTACHRTPEHEAADAGPALSFAGGLHWPGYLRQSIRAPSAFILPRPEYATPGPDGTTVSMMPKLDLPERDTEDIVAYLASLR